MAITFLLNGAAVEAEVPPTLTLLDWLRARGLTGTKEGCNEGDCGACSVIVTDERGARVLNACILFLPQVDGAAVRTVEGIAGPDGTLHPVQEAMIAHHGSQCGFCTPGFVVAMAAAHAAGRTDHDDALAGNLCRCTGYAPIVRAAEAAAEAPVPDWMEEDPAALAPTAGGGTKRAGRAPGHAASTADWGARDAAGGTGAADRTPAEGTARWAMPADADALANWYLDHPGATLVAGATDVGLWVTKGLRDLGDVAFLARCHDLARITETDDAIRVGAGVTLSAFGAAIARHHPDFAEIVRRYGSDQIRNAATIGGNVANGSPIGDGPPPLIALGARLHLRRGAARREIALEDFFLDYGRQDRAPGEFVEAITIPKGGDRLRAFKVSKRFDQDISAVCGAFALGVADGIVVRARIAFGGMAGIPKRARAVEAALIGRPWTAETVEAADGAWAEDFAPISDMRASADYRLEVARGLLRRCLMAERGIATSVLEVVA